MTRGRSILELCIDVLRAFMRGRVPTALKIPLMLYIWDLLIPNFAGDPPAIVAIRMFLAKVAIPVFFIFLFDRSINRAHVRTILESIIPLDIEIALSRHYRREGLNKTN